jgi:catechol 2,3-dioxygenase-like lactoylglutathione lyase family enzyme
MSERVQRSSPIKVEGVTTLLEVFDMGESVAFYRDKLGFEVVHTSNPGADFTWALLELDGAALMLNTAYDEGDRPPERDRGRAAAHRDTALFFQCRDLDAAYRHLLAKGVEVAEPTLREYGMRQLWLRDPDGFRLCLQCPARGE